MLRNTLHKLFYLLAIFLFLASCFRRIDSDVNSETPFTNLDETQIDDLLFSMSVEQKIGQLIIGQSSIHYEWDAKILSEWLIEGKVGGLLLENLALEKYLDFIEQSKGKPTIPAFFATNQKVALHNQFSDLTNFPTPATIGAVDSIEIQNSLLKHYIQQCKGLGINLSLSPSIVENQNPIGQFDFQNFESDPIESMGRSIRYLNAFKKNRILSIGDHFSDFLEDKELNLDSILSKYDALIKAGISGFSIGDEIFDIDTLGQLQPHFLSDFSSKELNFNGLLISNINEKQSIEKAFHIGSDIFITTSPSECFNILKEKYDNGILSKTILNQKVRKVLMAKSWVHGGKLPHSKMHNSNTVDIPKTENKARLINQTAIGKRKHSYAKLKTQITTYFKNPIWDHYIRMIYGESVILANNPQKTIPYLDLYAKDFRIIQFSKEHLTTFKNYYSKYAPHSSYLYKPNKSGTFSNFDLNKFRWSNPVIILNQIDLQNTDNQELIESINNLSRKTNTVLINFGDPRNLAFFDSEITTIQIFEVNDHTESIAARLLFGGASSTGKLPLTVSPDYYFGKNSSSEITRLKYAEPEDVGIDSRMLSYIDTLAKFAISDTMTPGCQILIAKNGNVIYSKAFGKHTYNGNQRVKTSDLYDLASVTKIAATTLATMKLVDEEMISIEGKIENYLTQIDSPKIKELRIEELLTHQSGLQPNMPIAPFLSRRNLDIDKGVFSTTKQKEYSVQVSKNLFLNSTYSDEIWESVFQLEVGEKREFTYSDVNFNILQKVIESKGERLDQYTFQNFFKPLGIKRIGFLPLNSFSKYEIVPTEYDRRWRNELLRGYPHDQTAALLGGVAGNAGLFANAEDLAVLFQMLLNEGTYGNDQYLKPETVKKFTSATESNQRGLGFNKPGIRLASGCSEYASPATFGHSGYTGTCVWVDLEEDLIYIFLSNRVHPNASNRKLIREEIRTKIHDIVYQSLNSFELKLPDIEMALKQG